MGRPLYALDHRLFFGQAAHVLAVTQCGRRWQARLAAQATGADKLLSRPFWRRPFNVVIHDLKPVVPAQTPNVIILPIWIYRHPLDKLYIESVNSTILSTPTGRLPVRASPVLNNRAPQ